MSAQDEKDSQTNLQGNPPSEGPQDEKDNARLLEERERKLEEYYETIPDTTIPSGLPCYGSSW